jgi:hypothetical protein
MFLDYELRARWGRYRYLPITDIPSAYLRWALAKARSDRKGKLVNHDDVVRIKAELFRRAGSIQQAA